MLPKRELLTFFIFTNDDWKLTIEVLIAFLGFRPIMK